MTFTNPDRIFPELGGEMLSITCKNHPTARYLMKNMRGRTLHFITPPDEFQDGSGIGPMGWECDCPMSDLVLVEDGREVFPKVSAP